MNNGSNWRDRRIFKILRPALLILYLIITAAPLLLTAQPVPMALMQFSYDYFAPFLGPLLFTAPLIYKSESRFVMYLFFLPIALYVYIFIDWIEPNIVHGILFVLGAVAATAIGITAKKNSR